MDGFCLFIFSSFLLIFFVSPGPPSSYTGSWAPSHCCPAPSYTPPAPGLLQHLWGDTRLPRLLHRCKPRRGNTGCFRWSLVIWNQTQCQPSEFWAGMHEAGYPGQPGFAGWFLSHISNTWYWEKKRLEHGGDFAGWSGPSGAQHWSSGRKEYPEACWEWAGFPRCPGHVSINGRSGSTFGLSLPVRLYWLTWFIIDLVKEQVHPFRCRKAVGLEWN